MLTETIIEAKKARLDHPAELGAVHAGGASRLGPAVRPPAEALKGRAVADFFRGLDVLRLSKPGIPDFDELNERLFARTGWTIVSVPGLVPGRRLLRASEQAPLPGRQFHPRRRQPRLYRAARRLPRRVRPCAAARPAGGRRFHAGDGRRGAGGDARPARCTGWRGSTGTASSSAWRWRTGETRIYGAGLLSSFGESRFALESPEPRRSRVRSQAGAAHPLPLRRLPAGLFRHRQLRRAAAAAAGCGSRRRSMTSWRGRLDPEPTFPGKPGCGLAGSGSRIKVNVLVHHVDLAHPALLAGGVDEAAELLAPLLRLAGCRG